MSCVLTDQNLAVYLQGVAVKTVKMTYDYLITASMPSSSYARRVWRFEAQGVFETMETVPSQLILDYTEAHKNCPLYNITFDGALNGTLIVNNRVFSANKFVSYSTPSAYVIVFTFLLPRAIQRCHDTISKHPYYFSVNLNDAAVTTCCDPLTVLVPDYIATYSNQTVSCLTWSYNGKATLSITPSSDVSGNTLVVAVGNLQTTEGNTNVLYIDFEDGSTGVLDALQLYNYDSTDCSGSGCTPLCVCSGTPCASILGVDVGYNYQCTYAYNDTSGGLFPGGLFPGGLFPGGLFPGGWFWYLQTLRLEVLLDSSGFVSPCPFSDTSPASPFTSSESCAESVLLEYANWEWYFTLDSASNFFGYVNCSVCPKYDNSPTKVIRIYLQTKTPFLNFPNVVSVYLNWGSVTSPDLYYIVKMIIENNTEYTQSYKLYAYLVGTTSPFATSFFDIAADSQYEIAYINTNPVTLDSSGNCVAPIETTFQCYVVDQSGSPVYTCSSPNTPLCPSSTEKNDLTI